MNLQSTRQQLGQDGERFASHYAEAILGWRILEHNVRFKCGEIDVICLDEGGKVVFIEVKTRRGQKFGYAMESLTPQKVLRFKRACLEWLSVTTHAGFRIQFRMECFAVQVEKEAWSLQRFEIE